VSHHFRRAQGAWYRSAQECPLICGHSREPGSSLLAAVLDPNGAAVGLADRRPTLFPAARLRSGRIEGGAFVLFLKPVFDVVTSEAN